MARAIEVRKDNLFPELVTDFNVYDSQGNKLIGMTGEVTLPDLSQMTETISGNGMLGEMESVIPGKIGSMEQEIPFRVLEQDIFSLMNPTTPLNLTLRGSIQESDFNSGKLTNVSIRIVERGRMKAFKPGTLKTGAQMGASVTLELSYIKIEIDGREKFELDKLNGIYKIDGNDVLATIRSQC